MAKEHKRKLEEMRARFADLSERLERVKSNMISQQAKLLRQARAQLEADQALRSERSGGGRAAQRT